ncbi:MAG: cobyrinate a,c-diamide synthase, partial [Bacteroidota bacterium]
MLDNVNSYIQKGGKVFAECGGLMYLGKSIIDRKGRSFSMANVFDFTTSIEHVKMYLGYREVVMDDLRLKGHEFHYSTFSEQHETPFKAFVLNARGVKVTTNIFVKNKAMASYIHHYFGEEDGLVHLINKLEKL